MIDYGPTTVLVDDRGFLEGPRWRNGELWLSDLHRHEVLAVTPTGSVRTVLEIDDQPSGLGFLPNGDLLVVSLLHRTVLRGPTAVIHADLTKLTVGGTNDMIVDSAGRAYVGSFGYDLFGRAPKAPGNLVLITPDGHTRIVADGLEFPNGMAITATGTLLVAESYAQRITEFDIAEDGSLSGQRVWAELDGDPDGIALDGDGALWIALAHTDSVMRLAAPGVCTARVRLRPGWTAVSCAVGGDDGEILFIASAKIEGRKATARLESIIIDTAKS